MREQREHDSEEEEKKLNTKTENMQMYSIQHY